MFGFLSILYTYFRPCIKWFLRRCTRLCELQRICYGRKSGAPRKLAVERSLSLSRQTQIKEMIKQLNECATGSNIKYDFHTEIVPYAISTILKNKQIKTKLHPNFAPTMTQCIESIWTYRKLCADVEAIRKITYDCANLKHEEKLLKLWHLLMPNQPLESRITKQWQDIGFQGDNPLSDFRGMGLLGLDNLLFFADEYSSVARHVLSHSMHPVHGYTFAIVGINLTSLALTLLQNGLAKTHFYNLTNYRLCVKDFHNFYCYIFYEFDKYWMQRKPKSLMEFSKIHESFLNDISVKLKNEGILFKMNLVVENV